jgi:nitrogen regulatory protein PII-like uncharacterized protein
MKKTLNIIGIIALTAIATYFITDYFGDRQRDIIRQSYQERIDSIRTVVSNGVRKREALLDSLAKKDKKFKELVESSNEKIANYTNIIGKLRLEADKLQDSLSDQSEFISTLTLLKDRSRSDGVFKDTTLSFQKTWTDSLFLTTAYTEFRNDSLRMDVSLEQLRNIDLDIVTTVSDDKTRVNTFVRSPDFDSLEVKAFTEIQPKKRKPWGWVAASALAVLQLARSIFN